MVTKLFWSKDTINTLIPTQKMNKEEFEKIQVTIKAEGSDIRAELNAVLAKHGIVAYVQSFTLSNTEPVLEDSANPEKIGFCCWLAGTGTMGCGLCWDF